MALHAFLAAVPWLNIALGLVAFAWLIARTWTRRREYPQEVLLLLWTLTAFVMALLVVSLEMAVAGVTINTAIAISNAKALLIFVLWRTRNALYRTGTRNPDGDDLVNGDEVDVDRPLNPHRVRRVFRGRKS